MSLRHIDIGSRFDGFVSNVASFREVEISDIRNIPSDVPGVTFRQADMMNIFWRIFWNIAIQFHGCMH